MCLPKAKPGQRRRTEHSDRVCPQAPVPQGFRGSNPLPRTSSTLPRKLDPEVNTRIAEHAFWMQRNGYRESTIRAAVKTLRHLARNCNLLDPNSFLDYNATAQYGDNRRCHILDDTARFYKSLNLPFQT